MLFAAKAREARFELALFVSSKASEPWQVRGATTPLLPICGGSLFTVMHADWDDLNPLLERFDIDELVAFRKDLQNAIESQFERQFEEAEAAGCQGAAADPGPEPKQGGPTTTTPASSASSSGAQPGLGTAPAEGPTGRGQEAGSPTGKGPYYYRSASGVGKAAPDVAGSQSVREGGPTATEQEGQRPRQFDEFARSATYQESRGPEAGPAESHANPGRCYVLRHNSAADSRRCDVDVAGHGRRPD